MAETNPHEGPGLGPSPAELAEEERHEIFNILSSIGDRTVRLTVLKPQIDSAVNLLRAKLTDPSPQTFETIGVALKRCGTELSHKAPLYGTVLGLLCTGADSHGKKLAARLADAVANQLMSALREGRAAIARRALRYLACLAAAHVVDAQAVADYLRILLENARTEVRAQRPVPHARSYFLADIALSALPWAVAPLSESIPEELELIAGIAEDVIEEIPAGRWRALAVASDSLGRESFPELIRAFQALKKASWFVDDSLIPDVNKEYAAELADVQSVRLPTLVVPAHSKLSKYAAPRFRLKLVNEKWLEEDTLIEKDEAVEVDMAENGDAKNGEKDVDMDAEGSGAGTASAGDGRDSTNKTNVKEEDREERVMTDTGGTDSSGPPAKRRKVKGKNSILEHYVKSMYVRDVLDSFAGNHVMAAERLLTMPMLTDSNDEVVEGLFSEMCATPVSPFASVYYGVVFVDLCKVKDSRLPVKLLLAVETMFQQSKELDQEVFDKLTDWFAFHLSNFNYKWNWSDWAVYADPDMVDKFPYRALFCRDVLMRCIRLAYFGRIRDMVPEEMKFFLPPEPNEGNMSLFVEEHHRTLMAIVTGPSKQPPDVVREKLIYMFPPSKKEDEEQRNADNTRANLQRLEALLRSILKAGYKTLSHFDTVCERYLALLLEMTAEGGVEARRKVAHEVSVFWDSSHLRRMYVLDKLSTHRVIDGLAILDCVLSLERVQGEIRVEKTKDELIEQLSDSGVWEIVRLVLTRAVAREDSARKELDNASRAAAGAIEGDMEETEARLERAKSGAANSKKEINELLLLSLRRLFILADKILSEEDASMMDDINGEDEGELPVPGLGSAVWCWRTLGMIRELGRKHPTHIGNMLETLRTDTAQQRERHKMLQQSFDILEEIATSDIRPHAC